MKSSFPKRGALAAPPSEKTMFRPIEIDWCGYRRADDRPSGRNFSSDEIEAMNRVYCALEFEGPMWEEDLKRYTSVNSIGAIYTALRDEFCVGRLWAPAGGRPDSNDKLYFLSEDVDPEWAYANLQSSLRRSDSMD